MLKFTPAANLNGTAVVTVTVTDGGLDGNLATGADNGTFSRAFTVTVNAAQRPAREHGPRRLRRHRTALPSFSRRQRQRISIADADGNVSVVTDLSVTAEPGGHKAAAPPSPRRRHECPHRRDGLASQQRLDPSHLHGPANAFPFVGQVTLTVDTNDLGNIAVPGRSRTRPGHHHRGPVRQAVRGPTRPTVDEDTSEQLVNVLANDIDPRTLAIGGNGNPVTPGQSHHGTRDA